MWDIKQIITLKYRQCDKLSISRWSDVNAIFLAVPARKIATSNHLEIDSSSHHRIFGDYLLTIMFALKYFDMGTCIGVRDQLRLGSWGFCPNNFSGAPALKTRWAGVAGGGGGFFYRAKKKGSSITTMLDYVIHVASAWKAKKKR